jgi:hypothetical protein
MAPMEDIHQQVVASPGSTVPDAEMLSPDSDDPSSPSPSPSAAATREKEHRQLEERTCHMMPCSIDYQGMTSTHVYFRPVEADGVLNSTFRGRGLLALAPPTEEETKNDDDKDRYLAAALISVQNQQLQVKAEIDQILEWQHEHNPETLFLRNNGDGTATNRVQVAQDWCDVALAVRTCYYIQRRD